ncbi:MAG: molybdopterin oxidoreductase [Deltaproteobacteria bacterium]|nr:molybdopterin oxidoreductase [Deltaproteobacteria bacterium]
MSDSRTVRSYCRICIAACGVLVDVEGDRVVRVKGDPNHPLSRGYTCPKGRAMGELQHHAERLDHPMLRPGGRESELEVEQWSTLMEDLTGRLAALRAEHGEGAIGIYLGTGGGYDSLGLFAARMMSAMLPLPSTYSAMTIDTPCLPLVSSLMSGSMLPNPVLDVEDVRLTLILGSNPMVSHGHTTAWPNPTAMLRRLAGQGRELWVADPRKTQTAREATRHLPILPSSDHALLAYLVRELLGPEGGADREHLAARAMDVERLERAVADWDLERACAETGLPESDLLDLLASIRRCGRLALLTGTGCSMQKNANVVEWLAWALQIVTNSFERPGGQWFHPGASNRFELMPAFDEPRFRDSAASSARPGIPRHVGEMPCSVMADEIEAGNLRGLVVLGGDPLTSFPNPSRIRDALESLDVLAVVDIVRCAMTGIATHVLPAAAPLERHDIPGYMESSQVTAVSQIARPIFESIGNRRPQWWMLAKIGEAMGVKVLPEGVAADDAREEALLRSLVEGGRSDYDAIAQESAIVIDEVRKELRGWVEEKLPQGRWRIAPVEIVKQLEAITRATGPLPGSLRMVSGRQLRKMNSAFRQVRAPGERFAEALIRLHASDVLKAGIDDGARIRLTSASGFLEGRVKVDPSIGPGAVWVPHGWPELEVGRLTSTKRDVDPLTGMVVQTGVFVTLEPATRPRSALRESGATSSSGS